MDPNTTSLANASQPTAAASSPRPSPPEIRRDCAAASTAAASLAFVVNQPSEPGSPSNQGDASRQPPLTKRNVPALRAELISKSLSSHGNKEALVTRLRKHYATAVAAAAAGLGRAETPTGPVAVPAAFQSPMFTKHEQCRLFYVMSMSNIAESMAALRNPLSRQQLDAGVSKHDRWATLVEPEFNNPANKFVTPQCLPAYNLNPNLHPYIRSGLKLKAKVDKISLGTLKIGSPNELRCTLSFLLMPSACSDVILPPALVGSTTVMSVPCVLDWLLLMTIGAGECQVPASHGRLKQERQPLFRLPQIQQG